MQHEQVNKPSMNHQSESHEASSRGHRHLQAETAEPGIPLYLQRQPIEEEEEEEELQAKLEIGAPDDKYEQQADRVADQVMRMPAPEVQRQPIEEEEEMLQPKPLAESITPLGR